MIPLLASPLLKIGAIAIATIALWGWISYQGARIDRLKLEVAGVTAERALAVAAAHANEAAIAALKVEAERATKARAAVADKLRASDARLAATRKAIDNVDPTKECPVGGSILDALNGLRRTPARSGDASSGRASAAPGRIAVLPR